MDLCQTSLKKATLYKNMCHKTQIILSISEEREQICTVVSLDVLAHLYWFHPLSSR